MKIKEFIPYVVIIIVVILIRTFIVTPVRVQGTSMVPTLQNKEILLLKKYDQSYKRFDIVVLKYNGSKLVKRVIGLPGETVKYIDNVLYINDKEYSEDFLDQETNDFDLKSLGYDKIPEGYYFVMGDNRSNSTDSRYIGLIKKSDIIGTTSFSIFPFSTFGSFK